MTIELTQQESAYLLQSIREARAFLVLGAGASKTSKNKLGNDVKLAWELAERLAKEAGLDYGSESLSDVLEAVRGNIIGEARFREILGEEYLQIKPSSELTRLFSHSWHRCYNWNIDDAVQNVKGGVQTKLDFNGISDGVYTDHSITQLPIIHLHGQAQKPDNGFIFSKGEYSTCIVRDSHKWYKQLAIDYGSYVPIFVGSKLAEPILELELERARGSGRSGLGQAFLVDPSKYTPIEMASLAARGIAVLNCDLAQFVDFVDASLGRKTKPADVAAARSVFAGYANSNFRLTPAQIEASQSILEIRASKVDQEIRSYDENTLAAAARAFLEGSPPNWRLARSRASIQLHQVGELIKFLETTIDDESLLVGAAIGQLASGKSTALMQALLAISERRDDQAIFEIKRDAKSLRSVVTLLKNIRQENQRMIIYFSDVTPFGDSFVDDISLLDAKWFTVITSARSGEWKGRLARRLRDVSATFQFERFLKDDFAPLIEKLLEFVPAPSLKKLSSRERIARLASSNSQLLIAMKETTSSRNFNELISHEYNSFEKVEHKMLLLLCGLGSLARTGIAAGTLEEAFAHLKPEISFDEARGRLEGVIHTHEGRYSARHEVYVRHIFENVADLSDILDAAKSLLSTFTQIRHPIIKNVPRLDAVLFKFLLNHQFVKEISWRHGEREAGLDLYRDFDREFQLDGHFWLQFGQYLTEIQQYEEALDKLTKSIEAYPENQFALHALADLQLRVAADRKDFDAETRQLIGDAVDTLIGQDASPDLGGDYYPIITLANGHIGALIAHDRLAPAIESAKDYLEKINKYRKYDESRYLRDAQRRLLSFLTTGDW